jgi:hypothetical protein
MGRMLRTTALAAALLSSACAPRMHLSQGTRIPDELRGASSAQIADLFTRVERGTELSLVATLIDFAYVRAVVRERDRTVDQEREAYDRYIRRQTTFYVYLTLHRAESCAEAEEQGEGDRAEAEASELALEGWDFGLQLSGGRDLELSGVEPGETRAAPTGGCIVQGYVRFDGDVPRDATWMALEVSDRDRDEELRSTARWDLGSWSPPPRRPRPARDAGHDAS